MAVLIISKIETVLKSQKNRDSRKKKKEKSGRNYTGVAENTEEGSGDRRNEHRDA